MKHANPQNPMGMGMGMGMGVIFQYLMGTGMDMGINFQNGYGYGFYTTRPVPAIFPSLILVSKKK